MPFVQAIGLSPAKCFRPESQDEPTICTEATRPFYLLGSPPPTKHGTERGLCLKSVLPNREMSRKIIGSAEQVVVYANLRSEPANRSA
jgi:hypothetical protein